MLTNTERIELLFTKLKQDFKETAKSLSIWVTAKGITGYGQSSIVNIRKGKSTGIKELNLIKYLTSFIEYLEENPNRTNIKEFSQDQIINSYLNQTFYLYHNGYNDDSLEERLSRVVLKVGKKTDDVDLFNINHRTTTDYKGKMFLTQKNSHLIFNLQTAKYHEKLLNLIFIRPSTDTIPEVMIGVYSNIDSKGALRIGTLVLEHLDKASTKEPNSLGIEYDSEEYKKVPLAIREFLKDKKQNRLKVTTGIDSIKGLEQFLVRQKLKQQMGRGRSSP